MELAANIVASHVSNNRVDSADLPGLIEKVFSALTDGSNTGTAPDRLQPAVPIKKSVFPDHIVCLEDGKRLKMLKRHLMTSYSMTPEQYREKWNLPPDYPMVAPNYAVQRRDLARKIGLGATRGRRPAAS